MPISSPLISAPRIFCSLSFPSRSRVGSGEGWEGCLIHINVSMQTGSHRAGFQDGHLSNRNIVLDSITWE